jgi:hypothetical protein
MSRKSDARLHEELVERIGRQQYLQPILEPGEHIDWESGVSCFRSVGGETSPVQEGFIALSDRRIFFVPNGEPPIVWRLDDIGHAQVISERKRTAKVRLAMRSGELWTMQTGRESAGYITNLANGTPFNYLI